MPFSRTADEGQHWVRHVVVNFSRQLDEAGAEVEFPGFPRKVERVDRDGVSAETRSGIERMKAERLGRSCCDDFPDVESHAQAEQLQLIDQGDVDAAVDIFQQLRHLCCGWRGDWNRAMEDGSVKSAR